MTAESSQLWTSRLDRFCAVTAGLFPVGVVIGNVAYEGVIAIVGICWLVRCCMARQNPLPRLIKHPLVLPWTAWYLVIIISLLVNGAGSRGWAHDFVFIRHLIFLLAMLDISRRMPVVKYLLYGLAAGVIMAAINTISAHLVGHDLFGRALRRYTQKLSDASRLAELLSYAGPFLLGWGLLDSSLRTGKKILVVCSGAVALVLLYVFGIRTSLLAVLTGIVFTLFINKRFTIAKFIIFVSAFLGMAVAYVMMTGLENNSISHRVYIWKIVWQMWLDHPIFGVGVSSFRDIFMDTAVRIGITEYTIPATGEKVSMIYNSHAHNLVLQLLSCTGILGLVAFAWLYFNTFRLIAADHDNWRSGLLSWPIVFFIIGLTGWDIYGNSVPAIMVFFIVLAGINNYSNENLTS